MKINSQPLETEQLRMVAKLHRETLPAGFLSSLSEDLISLIYQAIQAHDRSFLITSRDNGKLTGFVSGVEDVRAFYKWFIRNKFFQGSYHLLPHVFSFNRLRKVVELLFYPEKSSREDLPAAELLSLGIKKDYRNQGVARQLYQELVYEFEKRDIDAFRIVVGDSLQAAHSFYQKMGAEKLRPVEVHKDESSTIYLHRIK